MRPARPANDNWEFGSSTYKDAAGELIPNDAFENDTAKMHIPPERAAPSMDDYIEKMKRKIEADRPKP
jgi:hypothetical protein